MYGGTNAACSCSWEPGKEEYGNAGAVRLECASSKIKLDVGSSGREGYLCYAPILGRLGVTDKLLLIHPKFNFLLPKQRKYKYDPIQADHSLRATF